MPDVSLAQPLDDAWRDVLESVARRRRWPSFGDPARLAPLLTALSSAYNERGGRGVADLGAHLLPARLAFSFVRDVTKMAAAVRELVAASALVMPVDRPLEVLDVGAGLGAATWGLVRALRASGQRGAVVATWMDADGESLALGREVAEVAAARAVEGPVTLTVRTRKGALDGAGLPRTPCDVVLVGQVLSELHRDASDEARVSLHLDLLRALLETCTRPGGALVVVEPALKERTRHLHRVRDALLASASTPGAAAASAVSVFAPCLHGAPCPALARPTDWCHEDLAIDLPPWLVPLARGAGLRFEGLTFSYLVLRRDGDGLLRHLPPGAARLRVVSSLRRTKGKSEVTLCGERAAPADGAAGGAQGPGGVRASRLDRDARPDGDDWDGLERGDLVEVAPAPRSEVERIAAGVRVRRIAVDAASE